MTRSDVLNDFLKDIRDLGWDYEFTSDLQTDRLHACVDPIRNVVIFNDNSFEISDVIHEKIHIKEHHRGRLIWSENDERNSNETDANSQMIDEVISYQKKHEWPLNPELMMDWFGIASYLRSELEQSLVNEHVSVYF